MCAAPFRIAKPWSTIPTWGLLFVWQSTPDGRVSHAPAVAAGSGAARMNACLGECAAGCLSLCQLSNTIPGSQRRRDMTCLAGHLKLSILLLEEAEPSTSIEADATLMRCYSGVARDLPADAAVLDLRHLLFDGQPIERITVIRWLNLCYMSVYGRPFEQQTRQQSAALSAKELYQLLAFADAINSTKGPLVPKTCTAELEQLSMQISLEGEAVQLMMDGRPYWFCSRTAGGQTQLMFCMDSSMKPLRSGVGNMMMMKPLRSSEAMSAFAAEVAQQCEQLLLMAYKLQLDELLQCMQRFIAMAGAAPVPVTGSYNSTIPLLHGNALSPAVYSARVCEAAGYTEQQGQAAWAADQAGCQRQLCLLGQASSDGGLGKAKPCLWPLPAVLGTASGAHSLGFIKFKAEVQGQGFAGFRVGSEVDVTLDLAGNPTVKVSSSSRAGQFTFPVTLSVDDAS